MTLIHYRRTQFLVCLIMIKGLFFGQYDLTETALADAHETIVDQALVDFNKTIVLSGSKESLEADGLLDIIGVNSDDVTAAFDIEVESSLIVQLFKLIHGQNNPEYVHQLNGHSLDDQLKLIFNTTNQNLNPVDFISLAVIKQDLLNDFQQLQHEWFLSLSNQYLLSDDTVFADLNVDISKLSAQKQLAYIDSLNNKILDIVDGANNQKFEQFNVSFAELAQKNDGTEPSDTELCEVAKVFLQLSGYKAEDINDCSLKDLKLKVYDMVIKRTHATHKSESVKDVFQAFFENFNLKYTKLLNECKTQQVTVEKKA